MKPKVRWSHDHRTFYVGPRQSSRMPSKSVFPDKGDPRIAGVTVCHCSENRPRQTRRGTTLVVARSRRQPVFIPLCDLCKAMVIPSAARNLGCFSVVIEAVPATELRLKAKDFRFLTPLRCVRNDMCRVHAGVSESGSPVHGRVDCRVRGKDDANGGTQISAPSKRAISMKSPTSSDQS